MKLQKNVPFVNTGLPMNLLVINSGRRDGERQGFEMKELNGLPLCFGNIYTKKIINEIEKRDQQ